MPTDPGEAIGWLERLSLTFGPGGAVALFVLIVMIVAFVMRHREHRQDAKEIYKTIAKQAKDTDKAIDNHTKRIDHFEQYVRDEVKDVKNMLRRALRKTP